MDGSDTAILNVWYTRRCWDDSREQNDILLLNMNGWYGKLLI